MFQTYVHRLGMMLDLSVSLTYAHCISGLSLGSTSRLLCHLSPSFSNTALIHASSFLFGMGWAVPNVLSHTVQLLMLDVKTRGPRRSEVVRWRPTSTLWTFWTSGLPLEELLAGWHAEVWGPDAKAGRTVGKSMLYQAISSMKASQELAKDAQMVSLLN